MDLITLAWIVIFVGGGALAGRQAVVYFAIGPSWLGAPAGAVSGYLLLVVIAKLNSRRLREQPPCSCGNAEPDAFTVTEDPRLGFVRRCKCGLIYTMRKGKLWSQVLPDGSTELRARRRLFGKWERIQQ